MSGPLLVAVDLDAQPESIVDQAAAFAARLGLPLAVLHVLPLSPAIDPDVLASPAAHPGAQRTLRAAEATATPALQALGQRAATAGVSPTLHLAHGDAASVVIATATELGAELVALGTHGRRGLARAALGSVAAVVVRDCPVPVVTFRLVPPAHTVPTGRVQVPLAGGREG